MKFKDEYVHEMNQIRHNEKLDERILERLDVNEPKRKCQRVKLLPVAAAICVLMLALNFETITTYAERNLGDFTTSLGEEEVVFGQIRPVNFDYDCYLQEEKLRGGTSGIGADYDNYEDFYEAFGIALPGHTVVEYERISIVAIEKYHVGNIIMVFEHQGEERVIHARFLFSDEASGDLGFGTDYEAYHVYEYMDGEKAYFVRPLDYSAGTEICYVEDGEQAKNQVVYFATENLVCQITQIDNSEEETRKIEDLMDVIASEMISE